MCGCHSTIEGDSSRCASVMLTHTPCVSAVYGVCCGERQTHTGSHPIGRATPDTRSHTRCVSDVVWCAAAKAHTSRACPCVHHAVCH
eukprot:7383328-Prymnesium_polylepis.2